MERERGQIAILLILAMAVMGVVSVSVASRSIEGLRSTEIDRGSTTAFKAAEAGLEQAILSKANVTGTLADGVSFNASYNVSGASGFVTTTIDEGDVVSVSLAGASGVTSMYVYWNGSAAIKVSDLRGNTATPVYGVRYYTNDPNTASRSPANNFTAITPGSYPFGGVTFQNRASIPINLTVSPVSQILRILVLYQNTAIGVEPVGGTLADGQLVSVSSTGKVDSLQTKVTQQRFSEKLPAIFDNVLYTNGSLSQ